ncbi:MAG: cytochrome d ubiquinol oxidase subunit II [Rhizobiaceae bacterium]
MPIDLPLLWAVIIATAVAGYVVMDGFDLGVGMLFTRYPDRRHRDVLMNTIAPFWDGNETWLVLGGGGLFAAFPLAFAIIMPAVYAPVIAMLLGLVLRGVAFEFRWRTERGRFLWDWAFAGGSFLAAFAQGVILGAILQGINAAGRAYAGGWWDWLTPFSLLTGLAVVSGYMLLGATWLIMRTTGPIQAKARSLSRPGLFTTIGFIIAVSLATPFLDGAYFDRWLVWPGIIFALAVPLAVAAAGLALLRALKSQVQDWKPFVLTLALFGLNFFGLGVSMFPFIVPPAITISAAAAPEKSLIFMLWGVSILLPVIIGYTAYAYWVFRGKVDEKTGYH